MPMPTAMTTGQGLPWCSSPPSSTESGWAMESVPSVDNRARYNFFVSGLNRKSVWPEYPWITGEGEEEVSRLRPFDEPVRHGNPGTLGTEAHPDAFPPVGG